MKTPQKRGVPPFFHNLVILGYQGIEVLIGILEGELQSEGMSAPAAPAGAFGRPPLGLMRCFLAFFLAGSEDFITFWLLPDKS